jgi:hypothetical protein
MHSFYGLLHDICGLLYDIMETKVIYLKNKLLGGFDIQKYKIVLKDLGSTLKIKILLREL